MRAPPPVAVAQEPLGEQQGSLAGAISLVAGTTIGAGVLALPAKTIAAGFAPSAFLWLETERVRAMGAYKLLATLARFAGLPSRRARPRPTRSA